MTKVAKLVIINQDDQYLVMYRSNHPHFGNDPDLPGGTLEEGESPLDTMIREVYEEAGVTINRNDAQLEYEGTDYSAHKIQYSLYVAKLDHTPTVTISWEHSAYEWLDRKAFLEISKGAIDTYMHMVYDTLK